MADKRKQDRVLRELSKEANGSFVVLYRALTKVAERSGSSHLSKKQVEEEIKRQLQRQPA